MRLHPLTSLLKHLIELLAKFVHRISAQEQHPPIRPRLPPLRFHNRGGNRSRSPSRLSRLEQRLLFGQHPWNVLFQHHVEVRSPKTKRAQSRPSERPRLHFPLAQTSVDLHGQL